MSQAINFRPAIVVWGDAWDDTGEHDLRDWAHEPYVTHTCGWVFKDDEEGISICQEWWPTAPHNGRHPTFIPRGMVIAVRYMDE